MRNLCLSELHRIAGGEDEIAASVELPVIAEPPISTSAPNVNFFGSFNGGVLAGNLISSLFTSALVGGYCGWRAGMIAGVGAVFPVSYLALASYMQGPSFWNS